MSDTLLSTIRNPSTNSTKKTGKRKPRKKATKKPGDATATLTSWCNRYVIGAIAGSSLLNGYQSYNDGGAGWTGVAGALIGISIPIAVWTLAKCAGWAYQVKMRRMAGVIALVGAGLLLTSLWHVSTAIALLTGSGATLGWAVAVGLDCGLVATEAAAIIVEDAKK